MGVQRHKYLQNNPEVQQYSNEYHGSNPHFLVTLITKINSHVLLWGPGVLLTNYGLKITTRNLIFIFGSIDN